MDDLTQVENELGRKAVEGHRRRPDGTELSWKQIGIIELLEDPTLPFFIKWLSSEHPSEDGKAVAKIQRITVNKYPQTTSNSIDAKLEALYGQNEFLAVDNETDEVGIIKVEFDVNGSIVNII